MGTLKINSKLGLLAALSRRSAIFILIGIEMMLAAANINFIAFWRLNPESTSSGTVVTAMIRIRCRSPHRVRPSRSIWKPPRSAATEARCTSSACRK